MISISLVDDHTIVRDLMTGIISANDDMMIDHSFGTGEELIENLEKLTSDIILMDISLPGLDGLETTRIIREHNCDIPVLVLTMHLNAAVMQRAFKAGVNGYAVKHDPFYVLSDGIRDVVAGKRFISQAMDKTVKQSREASEMLARLSPREREIMLFVAMGKTAQDIAGELSISERTVDFHRRNIGEKTGLRKIADIVKFAVENNLIDT